jgi:hypothetical protein
MRDGDGADTGRAGHDPESPDTLGELDDPIPIAVPEGSAGISTTVSVGSLGGRSSFGCSE